MSAILEVSGLRKHFPVKGRSVHGGAAVVRAVDDVSFTVQPGQTLGIVGESGCGKSTTARLIMHLIVPDRGEIRVDGRRVGAQGGLSLKELRQQVQMVFQDSYASLNPRLCVADSIAFGPRAHGMSRTLARRKTHELLALVGLDPAHFAERYPHQLSGGQRQRVNIARALVMEPKIVIFDEAVSALDKSVEAQVLNLLMDLKERLGLTYLFISHDLNVVRYVADRVMVMYLGKVAEWGQVDDIYLRPMHPYTTALLASRPTMDPDRKIERSPLSGDPPSPVDPPSGCRFRTRCDYAEDVCAGTEPQLLGEAREDGHAVACHIHWRRSTHSQAPGV
jgi:peptide/nickel transport system ATP-binding protein